MFSSLVIGPFFRRGPCQNSWSKIRTGISNEKIPKIVPELFTSPPRREDAKTRRVFHRIRRRVNDGFARCFTEASSRSLLFLTDVDVAVKILKVHLRSPAIDRPIQGLFQADSVLA